MKQKIKTMKNNVFHKILSLSIEINILIILAIFRILKIWIKEEKISTLKY
jgi:hypothetical protein